MAPDPWQPPRNQCLQHTQEWPADPQAKPRQNTNNSPCRTPQPRRQCHAPTFARNLANHLPSLCTLEETKRRKHHHRNQENLSPEPATGDHNTCIPPSASSPPSPSPHPSFPLHFQTFDQWPGSHQTKKKTSSSAAPNTPPHPVQGPRAMTHNRTTVTVCSTSRLNALRHALTGTAQ